MRARPFYVRQDLFDYIRVDLHFLEGRVEVSLEEVEVGLVQAILDDCRVGGLQLDAGACVGSAENGAQEEPELLTLTVHIDTDKEGCQPWILENLVIHTVDQLLGSLFSAQDPVCGSHVRLRFFRNRAARFLS
jgi:hypothetical protein